MFKFYLLAALLGSLVQLNLSAKAVNSHIGASDIARLQNVFKEGTGATDLQSLYYSALNVDMLDEVKQSICGKVDKIHAESKLNDFEKNFYLIGVYKALNCPNKIPEKIASSLLSKDYATSQEMFFSLSTLRDLKTPVDKATKEKFAKNLQNILKKDDSISGLGYAFFIGAELGQPAAFVYERIEDAIAQADEIDGKMLQFEGGLSITALIINGALKLSKVLNKPVPIPEDKAVKFATYFLSRRSVQTPKGAHVLLEVLKIFSADTKISPICIQIIGNAQLQAESPILNLKIVNLLGAPLSSPPSRVSGKVYPKKGNTVLAEKVEFSQRSSDKTVFSADLSAYKPARNIYTIDVAADSYVQNLEFKVLGKVKVHSLEIGVGDADSASALKKQNVMYPSSLQEILSADHTQKVVMKVVLTDDGTTKVISVHQAFVRLAHKETDEEIIYVAEQDTTKAYKFDMDVGSRSADFGHKSGLYKLELIVGDASISNSFRWHIADINLKFINEPKRETSQGRAPLPEIKHMFREPEKRPARIVSDIFTGLCLTPLVLLFILWAKLGINVSNFSFGLSTLGFHLGFGAILGLFGVFWLQLTMFDTIRYLIPVAIFTFLCGNRLLRSIASQKPHSQ